MTQVAHRRDFAELTSLLASQKDAYVQLLSLSRGQEKVFTKGGARWLMRVIARKQAVIDQIDRVDRELLPYTSTWQDTIGALPEPARREIATIVTDMAAVVHDLMESERAIEELVSGQRDRKVAEIRAVSGGRTAVAAYSQGGSSSSGRYLDREG